MIYIIWSGADGSSGDLEEYYFTTKKAADGYVRMKYGARLEKQPIGSPLYVWMGKKGEGRWADIEALPMYKQESPL
jgi:hypothetical protein